MSPPPDKTVALHVAPHHLISTVANLCDPGSTAVRSLADDAGFAILRRHGKHIQINVVHFAGDDPILLLREFKI